MTPERIAELRKIVRLGAYTPIWDEMLDEIERLRGLASEAHFLVDRRDEHGFLVRWSCLCGRWGVSGPQATKFAPLPHVDEDEARSLHAAHVAEILDGGAS